MSTPGIAQVGTGITSVATSAATEAAEPKMAAAVRRAGTELRRVRRHGNESMSNTLPKFHYFHTANTDTTVSFFNIPS